MNDLEVEEALENVVQYEFGLLSSKVLEIEETLELLMILVATGVTTETANKK